MLLCIFLLKNKNLSQQYSTVKGQLAIRSQRTDGTSVDRKPDETDSTKLKNAPTMTTMPKETDGTIEMPAMLPIRQNGKVH
ncbi:hypothetical protein KIN20_010456 [Parelaphostrongylus tenuis]|uniref:Uncharacterized protein n=1 Tax=Parelaphostrongylus tenuis TaxID=148309 RepID=A0AAD5M9N9_PARTN|nr:hypothetical protein KIN20_010456 [Parelaphostrongylus tenuis]